LRKSFIFGNFAIELCKFCVHVVIAEVCIADVMDDMVTRFVPGCVIGVELVVL
jgi:hypothetical protein